MDDEKSIIQNLKDAGCSGNTIAAFVTDLRKERIEDGLKLLALHRRSLLDNLHKEQQRIDCLDYLIYTLRQNQKTQVSYKTKRGVSYDYHHKQSF